jgi:hypothetical protein
MLQYESARYGAVHLVTATFGQWLCSPVVGNFFKFSYLQNLKFGKIRICFTVFCII